MVRFNGKQMPPPWGFPLRLGAAAAVYCYTRCAYRIRGWGELPRFDAPSLVVSNHQIDIDLMGIVGAMGVHGAWRAPFFSASARMLYEPGFIAGRIPWLADLLHNVNLGWLFRGLGLLPIENELRTRPLARWAYGVQRVHGVLPLERVFKPEIVERYELHGLRTCDLFSLDLFHMAQGTTAKLTDLLPPHRREQLEITCRSVEEDLARIESCIKQGATFYVTPEGEYSRDGAMLPFRGIWERLAPYAERVHLAGISYEPFADRRLSQLYRIVPLRNRGDVVAELKACRPVTAGAMLCSWLSRTGGHFSLKDAQNGVAAIAGSLPSHVFVDPEFRSDGDTLVYRALDRMRRLGIVEGTRERLRLCAVRRHPQFPDVEDIVAFQARFLAETLEGARRSTTAKVETGEIAGMVLETAP